MNKDFFCHQDEPEKLYRIGVFSQMNHITVKTLRHYDEIGLLKPAYVDEDSGYPTIPRISCCRCIRYWLFGIWDSLWRKYGRCVMALRRNSC